MDVGACAGDSTLLTKRHLQIYARELSQSPRYVNLYHPSAGLLIAKTHHASFDAYRWSLWQDVSSGRSFNLCSRQFTECLRIDSPALPATRVTISLSTSSPTTMHRIVSCMARSSSQATFGAHSQP